MLYDPSDTVLIHFLKLHPNATIPKKANINASGFQDAAFDLFPVESRLIRSGERVLISTGLAALIQEGYWIKFHERSGLAAKNGIHILGGVIDNTYTGEFKVVMYNSGDSLIEITPEKAIAQFTVERLTNVAIHEIDLTGFNFLKNRMQVTRQAAGFGSTDNKK